MPNDYSPVLIAADSMTHPFYTGIVDVNSYLERKDSLISVNYAISSERSELITSRKTIMDLWGKLENTPEMLTFTEDALEFIKESELRMCIPMPHETLIPIERIVSFGTFD
tara:strand:- start:382 stop:714 length:333 start_codon:yes stop_codon:yes gene_type:complete